MCTNGTTASRIMGNTEVETLGQLSPSNVDPPCPEDVHCLPRGTHRKEQELRVLPRKSVKGPLAPGEPKDQRTNETQNVMLPLASQGLQLHQQKNRQSQTSSGPRMAGVLSSLVDKEAVAGV